LHALANLPSRKLLGQALVNAGARVRSGQSRRCRKLIDVVDKVGDEQRAGNNRIQVPSFLNQSCAPDSDLESMLLTRTSKNVYRQHRSGAEALAHALLPPSMRRWQVHVPTITGTKYLYRARLVMHRLRAQFYWHAGSLGADGKDSPCQLCARRLSRKISTQHRDRPLRARVRRLSPAKI
jgi:hypothetical protein